MRKCAGLSKLAGTRVGVNYFGTAEFVEALQPALAAADAPRVAAVASISGTQPFDADLVAAGLPRSELCGHTRSRAPDAVRVNEEKDER